MNSSIHLKHVRGNALLKNMIERKTDKIESMLRNYQADMADLTAIIEKNVRKQIFNSKLVLKLPTGTLICEKQGFSSFEAISKSFKSLFMEINEHIKKLKHKKEFAKEMAVETQSKTELKHVKTITDKRNEILSNIASQVQYFIQYAREEINILQQAYQRQINFILPEEIVDSAIIQILDENSDQMSQINDYEQFEKQMYITLKKMLKEQVEDRIANHSDISVEARYKEPMISEDEIYDYYQPDISWNLADVLSTAEYNLEEESNDQMHVTRMNEFIETLFPENRQLFYLYYIKKFNINELEIILDKPAREIKKALKEIAQLIKANNIPI